MVEEPVLCVSLQEAVHECQHRGRPAQRTPGTVLAFRSPVRDVAGSRH